MRRYLFISVGCLLSLVSLSGCGKDYITGKSTLNYYSLKSDVQLGQYVMQQQLKSLEGHKKKLDAAAGGAELHRIRRITHQIAAISHISNFPYEVHLADVDVVNAWCAPGGKVMVYTGLWAGGKEGSKTIAGLVRKEDDHELAAVLAHEIAHATARHVTERLSSVSTILLVGEIAASVIAGAGSAGGSDIFREVFYQGVNIYVPSYSRSSESEADRIGLFYMAKAGYNPEAAVRLWERAAKTHGNKSSIYASHPSSGERAANLKKILPEAMAIYHQSLKGKSKKRRHPPIKPVAFLGFSR